MWANRYKLLLFMGRGLLIDLNLRRWPKTLHKNEFEGGHESLQATTVKCVSLICYRQNLVHGTHVSHVKVDKQDRLCVRILHKI